MTVYRSLTLSVTIQRHWMAVYAYASNPATMHEWAQGLGESFQPDGEYWSVRDPAGNLVRVRFTPTNTLGILDHDVHVGDRVVHIAMRVMPNGDGAEVNFLLLQTPDLSDADFERDAEAVRKDLEALKAIMEK